MAQLSLALDGFDWTAAIAKERVGCFPTLTALRLTIEAHVKAWCDRDTSQAFKACIDMQAPGFEYLRDKLSPDDFDAFLVSRIP
jgi:hypothetical protein